MKYPPFLKVVPSAVKVWALIALGCAALIGVVAGFNEGSQGRISAFGVSGSMVGVSIGLLVGLAAGLFLATWLACLGYVFADARRRAMPPVLWTLVSILVPNLLGFLLYFAIRRPISLLCSHCGQTTLPGQRFCAWCGQSAGASPTNSPAAGFSSAGA